LCFVGEGEFFDVGFGDDCGCVFEGYVDEVDFCVIWELFDLVGW